MPSNKMVTTPKGISSGDTISSEFLNRIVNTVLRLIQGDGKTIAVNYVSGKATISLAQRQIIPLMSGGGGDDVIVASTKAGLGSPASNAYFTRGWVTGETGTNYGPWAWDGAAWSLVPVVYTTLSNNARPGDTAIVSSKGYTKVTSGTGSDKWVNTTNLEA